jgi:anti-sigma factor RsiW
MMNCFEARQEFIAFWRGQLPAEERQVLVRHLGQCARCDHAFRSFALTAPVLHSDAEPPQSLRRSESRESSRRAASAYREAGSSRPAGARGQVWAAACAALSMVVVAGFAAYFATAVPHETLDQTLTSYQGAAELFSQQHQQLPALTDDLAG